MDYDRYRNASYDDYDPRDSRAYGSSYNHDTQHHVPLRGRSRSSSNAASDGLPQPVQPLKSAIGNAFDQSDAARTVDPELIAQIAAEVKKSVLDEIKQSGIASTSTAQSKPAPPQQYVPPSPDSTNASFPPRNVYTPPSPHYQDTAGHQTIAQDLPYRESNLDGCSDDSPKPRHKPSVPIDIPRQEQASERPAPAVRMATDDFTPIEKMWQRLFDPEGQPLPRLGEFLRGLAMHLVCSSDSFVARETNDCPRSKTTSRRRVLSFRPPKCCGSTTTSMCQMRSIPGEVSRSCYDAVCCY